MSWQRVLLAFALSSVPTALSCGGGDMQGSGGGGTVGTGHGGAAGTAAAGTNGSAGSAGGGAGGASAGTSGATAGTGGGAGTATATAGTSGAAGTGGGTAGHAGSGVAGAAGTASGGHGGGVGGAAGGAGGGVSCAGRAVSLSANGTSSDSDSAFARVEIDMKTDLPIMNAKRTVEFWAFIKSTDWVGEKNEVYYYGSGASAAAFGLDFGTSTVVGMGNNHATLNPFTNGGFNDDTAKDLGITSTSDQWVHLAMVWDGTALITYVNGLPKITTQGSGGITALATTQSLLLVGCNPSNNQCFNGLFDEFRVWKAARTAMQIKDNYNKPMTGTEADLVGYWKFDEASGTTTADAVTASGHTAHPGTLKADTAAHNPTFVTPSVALPLVCNP